MRKVILSFITLIIITSCNQKNQEFVNHLLFDELVSKSDQLIIKLYDSTLTKQQSRNVELLKPKIVYNVAKKKITDFKSVFEKAEETGYCCCPISSYSISFLENNKQLDVFYVDTIEFKSKIRIYEGGYQYSFIIEKQKWKDFLRKIEN